MATPFSFKRRGGRSGTDTFKAEDLSQQKPVPQGPLHAGRRLPSLHRASWLCRSRPGGCLGAPLDDPGCLLPRKCPTFWSVFFLFLQGQGGVGQAPALLTAICSPSSPTASVPGAGVDGSDVAVHRSS